MQQMPMPATKKMTRENNKVGTSNDQSYGD